MRQTAIFGIVIAASAIVAGQLIEGYSLALLWQSSAFVIVLAGTIGATIARSSYKELKNAISMVSWLFRSPADGQDLTNQLVHWSTISNKEGPLKLDEIARTQSNAILRSGLEMISDHKPSSYIKETLLVEVYARDLRYRQAIKVWDNAAKFAPLIGLLAATLGLLNEFGQTPGLDISEANLGGALTAIAYGLFFSNLIFAPIAQSLKGALIDLTFQDEVRIEGLGMVADKKTPSTIRRSLGAVYDQPKTRRA